MSTPKPPILSASDTVACDGGGGALGHPRVFLTIHEGEDVSCAYCGQSFRLDPQASGSAAGH
jgi:uncharacterized Zn-finger protein